MHYKSISYIYYLIYYFILITSVNRDNYVLFQLSNKIHTHL